MTKQSGRGPPGTDTHSYVSIAPYWWPCTCTDPPAGAGCDTPPPAPAAAGDSQPAACDPASGLPWKQHDGVFNTQAIALFAARSQWDAFQAAFTNATLAYALTGDEEIALHAAAWARVWFLAPATYMRPNLDHGQFIPGVTDGRGIGVIDFSMFLTLGFLDGLVLLRTSLAWTPADEAGVQAWFRALLAWLTTAPVALEEADTLNNHLTFYRALVQAVALFVGDGATAAAFAASDAARVVDVQVGANGALPLEEVRTRSLHYVTFDLHALQSLATTARRAGVDVWAARSAGNNTNIADAAAYMAPFADGSQTWPFEQIDAFSYSELWDVFRVAGLVGDPAREREFLDMAERIQDPVAGDDVRRLLWPAGC